MRNVLHSNGASTRHCGTRQTWKPAPAAGNVGHCTRRHLARCNVIKQDVDLNVLEGPGTSIKKALDKDSDEYLGQLQSQGRKMAGKVARLRQVADERASKVQQLETEKEEEDGITDGMRQSLSEKEEEVALLRLQAERAALLEIESEIQQKLIADLRSFCDLQSTEVREIQSRFTEFENVLGAALEEVEESEQAVSELQQREAEMQNLKRKLNKQHAELQTVTEQLDQSRKSYSTLQQAADVARAECTKAEERLKKLSVKFTTLQQRYTNAKKSAAPKGFDPKQAKKQTKANKDVLALQEALEHAQKELKLEKEEVAAARKARDEATAAVLQAQQTLQQKMEQMTAQVKGAEAAALEEVEQLKRELDALRNSGVTESLEKAQTEVAQLKAEIDLRDQHSKHTAAQLEELRTELSAKGDALEAAKRASMELRNALKGHIAELERTKGELAETQEVVGQQAGVIEKLREEVDAAGSAAESKDAEIEALHCKVLAVRTHALKLEEALEAARHDSESESALRRLEEQLRAARGEYDGVSAELQRVGQELQGARRREEDRVYELNSLQSELDTEREGQHALEQQLQDLQEKSAALQQELVVKGKRLHEVETQLNEGGVIVRQRELEIRSLRSEVEKLKQREESWSLELQDAGLVTQQLTEKLDALEEALSVKDKHLAIARRDALRAREMAADATKNVGEATALMSRLSHLEEQLEEREAELKRERQQRMSLEAQVESLQRKCTELEEQYKQQASDTSIAESLRQALLDEATATRDLLGKAEALARAIAPVSLAGASGEAASDADVQRLHDELVKQQQAAASATEAARAAEQEAEHLRKTLKTMPSQGQRNGAEGSSLDAEQQALVQRASAVENEAAMLKEENQSLKNSIKQLEEQLSARQNGSATVLQASSSAGKVTFSADSVQLENDQLRQKALRASTLLKQSRKFIEKYLEQSDSMLKSVGISPDERRHRGI